MLVILYSRSFHAPKWPQTKWKMGHRIILWKIGIVSTFYRALPSTFKKFTRIYHWVEIPLLLMIHSALTSTHFSYWFTKIYSTKNYHLLAKPLVTSLYYPVNRACKCGVKLALGCKTFTLSIYRTVAHCIAWRAGDNKKSLLWSSINHTALSFLSIVFWSAPSITLDGEPEIIKIFCCEAASIPQDFPFQA